jgi:hypothetical protein
MKIRLGTTLHAILTPFVWVLWVLTFKRVDYRHCLACAERAKKLDALLNPPAFRG